MANARMIFFFYFIPRVDSTTDTSGHRRYRGGREGVCVVCVCLCVFITVSHAGSSLKCRAQDSMTIASDTRTATASSQLTDDQYDGPLSLTRSLAVVQILAHYLCTRASMATTTARTKASALPTPSPSLADTSPFVRLHPSTDWV